MFRFRFEAIEGSEGEQKIYTVTGCEGIAESNVHVAANLSAKLTRSLHFLLTERT